MSDSSDENGSLGHLPDRAEQWKSVIELANVHYLTPALWLALQDKGLVGSLLPDARAFLQEAHSLNVVRNTNIRAQALELLKALDGVDIRAVILKGGVHLFEGDRRAFESRMMVDLDLLVPEECLDGSFRAAEELGYEVLMESVHTIHHLNPIGRKGDQASVEIHRDVGPQKRILPAEEVLRDAVAFDFDGMEINFPSPTHRAVHNIFHSEIQSRNNYAMGRISPRYLHDLELLRAHHEAEIDWPKVGELLARQKYDYLVPGYLYLSHRLLGPPMPEAVPVSPAARRHYRWCLAQLKWPALKAVVSAFWGAGHAFRRHWMEYIYGEARNPLVLQLFRIRFFAYLANRHRFKSFAKVVAKFRGFVREP
jgi:hypothetical protein